MDTNYLENKIQNNVADILQYHEGLTGVIGLVLTFNKDEKEFIAIPINKGNAKVISNATILFLADNDDYREIVKIALRRARLLRYRRFIYEHNPFNKLKKWIKK